MTNKVLIVDDEEQLRSLLVRIVKLEHFEVYAAGTLSEARKLCAAFEFDVILCDVRLPDGNGIEFVQSIVSNPGHPEIILLTAYGTIADGVTAMKYGAFDYLVKGDDNDRLIPLLHQATAKKAREQATYVRPQDAPVGFEGITGRSPAIQKAIAIAERVARSTVPVLLLGETGTGKEVFANAIHHSSPIRKQPFVAINCSAFSRELLESELFGHAAGAFTGALKEKKGLVETAGNGTLFLDEIGEMNADLQARLLRFLENGEYFRVGDPKVRKANVRVIAATNRDLSADVTAKTFRADLYYRLNAVTISLPPLRERIEDIPLLVHEILRSLTGNSIPELHPDTMQLLSNHEWKGNIRELKNVLQRAIIFSETGPITPEHLPLELQQEFSANGNTLAAIEELHIKKILSWAHGNKVQAAQMLGIGVATLYRKLDHYNLSK